MQADEFTLKERAGRMYRQLLVLQQVFREVPERDETEWVRTDDGARNVALTAAIKEILDELTEHARTLTSTPFPISEWRPGDGPDDERWRALTEIERRELLALLSAYENLVVWGEGPRCDAADHLQDQRMQLGRFRKELTFLDRRRQAS